VERGSEEKRFKKSLCIIYCDTDGEKKNDSCCPVWCTTQSAALFLRSVSIYWKRFDKIYCWTCLVL